jgi:hypothetical protein
MAATLLRPVEEIANQIPDIDARQFGTGLWIDGLISYDECRAFVGQGAIPAAMQEALNNLPDDDTGAPTRRKMAIVLITGALAYLRSNPLVEEIAAIKGWDGPTMDAKWRAWAAL